MDGFISSIIDLSLRCEHRREKYEVLLMFDDAIAYERDEPYENQYVKRLHQVLAKHKLTLEYCPSRPWYGDCFHCVLPGPGMISLYVHLKDTQRKVRQLKRWSQVLAMDLILERVRIERRYLELAESSVFVLLVDGDTRFTKEALCQLHAHIAEDPTRLAAVSGRIHPQIRDGPGNFLVWFQVRFSLRKSDLIDRTDVFVRRWSLVPENCRARTGFRPLRARLLLACAPASVLSSGGTTACRLARRMQAGHARVGGLRGKS